MMDCTLAATCATGEDKSSPNSLVARRAVSCRLGRHRMWGVVRDRSVPFRSPDKSDIIRERHLENSTSMIKSDSTFETPG